LFLFYYLNWVIFSKTKNLANTKMADYEVLGLTPPSTSKAIRAAFIAKARQTHPDKGGTASDFRNVRDAYNRLISGVADVKPPMPKTDGWSDDWVYTSDDPPWMATAPSYWNQSSDTVEIESDSDAEAEEESDDDTTDEDEEDDSTW
jgi:hypothetical protein